MDVCGRSSSDTIDPLSIPVLVVKVGDKSFSVSSAIRYLFSDLTCFIVEYVLYFPKRTCFQTSSAFSVRNLSVLEIYLC